MGKAKKPHAGNGRMLFDLETLRGTSPSYAIYDEMVYEVNAPTPASALEREIARAEYRISSDISYRLSDDEYRWALAFRVALGCGPNFYESAPRDRRRQLEAHHIERATHATAKGRKSAKVVAMYMRFKLEGRTYGWANTMITGVNLDTLEKFAKAYGVSTGRLKSLKASTS